MPNSGNAASEKKTTDRPGGRDGGRERLLARSAAANNSSGDSGGGFSFGSGGTSDFSTLRQRPCSTPSPEASSSSLIKVQSTVNRCAHRSEERRVGKECRSRW